MRIAVSIKTKDRSPGQNYLDATLQNLARAGLWQSPHLHSLRIVDSGSPEPERFRREEIEPNLPKGIVVRFDTAPGRTLHQTGAEAIRQAAATDADWVLVLEDDLDFCADFLGSVAAWLEHHASPKYRLYAFGASYRQVKVAQENGWRVWPYRISDFYGAQALAWSAEDARDVAAWLGDDPSFEGNRNRSHDLLLQSWGRERGLTHFAASVPSFVQHVGATSSIGNKPFRFESWPGRGWRYEYRPRILWVGDATVSTGFARCTHAVCDALHAAGWDVHVLGMNFYGDPHRYPYPIYTCVNPIDGGRDPFGATRFPRMVERLQPDLVVLLNDPWNVPSYLGSLEGFVKQCRKGGIEIVTPKVAAWLAVDSANQDGGPLNVLGHVAVWTQFAAEELKRGGYDGEPSVVPLGVDHSVFYPRDQADARRSAGVPEKAFIVGVVGRNQLPRKRLDLTLEIFSEWTRKHGVEDAYLLLHSAPTGERGYDLGRLARYYGIPKGRVLSTQPSIGQGLSDEDLPLVYASMDVYLSASQGEGWCLPALEAMASGIPCIVPGFAGLGPYGWTGEAAVQVPCPTTSVNAPYNSMAYTVGGVMSVPVAVQELDAMYRSERHRATYRERGLRLAKTFTWERTGREMVAVLERVVRESKESAPQSEPAAAAEEAA